MCAAYAAHFYGELRSVANMNICGQAKKRRRTGVLHGAAEAENIKVCRGSRRDRRNLRRLDPSQKTSPRILPDPCRGNFCARTERGGLATLGSFGSLVARTLLRGMKLAPLALAPAAALFFFLGFHFNTSAISFCSISPLSSFDRFCASHSSIASQPLLGCHVLPRPRLRRSASCQASTT